VLECSEAMAAPFDFLYAQIQALGWTVGCTGVVVSQDLFPPRFEGSPQGPDFGDGVALAACDGLVQE